MGNMEETALTAVLGSEEDKFEDMANKVDDETLSREKKHDLSKLGPIKNRGCTDIICLLLFLAFIGGWIAVGIYGFSHGNPATLIYPSDSSGRICGKGDLKERPKLLFFDLTKCLRVSAAALGCPTKQVCVKECPQGVTSFWAQSKVDAIPDQVLKEQMKPFCDSELYDQDKTAEQLMKDQICPKWTVPSGSFLGRCVPFFKFENGTDIVEGDTVLTADQVDADQEFSVENLKKAVEYLLEVLNLRGYGEKMLNDVIESWWAILLGILLATLVSFIWVIMMRFAAAVMVWASIILSTAFLLLACVYSGMKFSELYSASDSFNDFEFSTDVGSYLELSYTWLVFLIVGAIGLLVVLLLLCFMRSRIKIAIELIEEASIAVSHMMSTLFFPLVPFALEVIFVAWFIAVGAFLASSSEKRFHYNINHLTRTKDDCQVTINGTQTTITDGSECFDENEKLSCDNGVDTVTCEFYKFGPTTQASYMQVYNLFGFFWGLFFLEALDQMVLAGAFASWYWTLDKRDVPKLPLIASFYRTLRYHLGTLAFGSLIIAIIRMIRVMIEYIEEKLKEYHQDNPLVKCCLCFCKCCFYCLEKFMKFLNRNAYIMTAIYGKNFCWSAKEAFMLLFRNMARVFVLDKVTDFLLLLGKLVVVGGVACASFYFFSGRIQGVGSENLQLNYYFVPIILITLGAYFIADIFFGVYEMAVDTLFLCFLEDIERNDGSASKPYFMSSDLKKILGYMEQKTPNSPH